MAIEVRIDGLEEVEAYLDALPDKALKQLKLAVKNGARRVRGRVRTQIGKKVGLKGNSLERRLHLNPRSDGVGWAVWFGANDIPVSSLMGQESAAALLGKKSSITHRGKTYEGAFMIRGKGGGVVSVKRGAGGKLERVTAHIKPEVDKIFDAQADKIGAEVTQDFIERMEKP